MQDKTCVSLLVQQLPDAPGPRGRACALEKQHEKEFLTVMLPGTTVLLGDDY